MTTRCHHLNFVKTDRPNTRGCEHATQHFHATTHPIITSIEPGEDWSWCYVDQLAMELRE
jgi:hypothetical protein